MASSTFVRSCQINVTLLFKLQFDDVLAPIDANAGKLEVVA
jgi:hypothetical protein